MLKDDPKPRRFHFDKLQKFIIKKYRPKNSNITSSHPTFPEFVDFIIESTDGLETHADWKNEV